MLWQMSAVAVRGMLAVRRQALQGPAGLLLGRLQYALRDLDIFKWQIELLGIELLGFGTKPLSPQFADDAFQPPLSLHGIRQRRLSLGEAHLQAGVLFGKAGIIHTQYQAHG